MDYLVPGPVLDRIFNFIFDYPSATGGRLLADLQREAKVIAAPAAEPGPSGRQPEPHPDKAAPTVRGRT